MGFRQTWTAIAPSTKKQLKISFAAGLLFWLCMAGQLPVVPLYVDSLGGTAEQVGLVMGAFAIGLLALRPQLGEQADRVGRVNIMRIGLLVATIVPIYYALFPAIPLIIVFRAVHGISIAAFATGYSALIADLAPPAQRGEVLGYMSLVNPLGLGIAPVLGVWLVEVRSYGWAFAVAAGCGALALALTYFLTEVIPEHGEKRPAPSGGWQNWWHPRVRVPATVLMLVGLAFGTLSAFMPLFLRQVGISINVGIFYMAAAIAGVSVRLPLAHWSDRVGRGIFVSIGICGYTLSSVLMFFAQDVTGVILSGAMEGMGAGLVIPSIITIVADRTTPNERGKVMGLVWMGFDLGIALAGPTLGLLTRFIGLQNAFAIATALTLLALAIFSTQSSGGVTGSWRFATGRGRDFWAKVT